MAKRTTKKTTKKTSTKKKTSKKTASSAASGPSGAGKKLVIVESPAKAKTINKYLGADYVVKASVGHIRDLPSKNPKGDKRPVPGIDLENDFEPTYEVLPGKSKTVSELKQAAKKATEVWFATDLDREGEAISWHLAHLLDVDPAEAKRVVFNAITKAEIQRAFASPRGIDQSKVDAQQARRILDRIVGYQVSPLLWKKVARGLSAGRVQSVAVRLVVEREREIRAFVPDERWTMTGRFALSEADAAPLVDAWPAFLETSRDDKGKGPTIKHQNAFLADRNAVKADLVAVDGAPLDLGQPGGTLDLSTDEPVAELLKKWPAPKDLTSRVVELAEAAGLTNIQTTVEEDERGRGPARFKRTVTGDADPTVAYQVTAIETKRTTSRPSAPFITSTLQQAASSRLGFGAQRTMRTAQRLYEGIEIKGEGAVGLITYMRTDSTHLSGDALNAARSYIASSFDDRYLPEKPNFFGSTNKAAQEAHEAIRPTDVTRHPNDLKGELQPDQWRLYDLIWRRFVACQMTPAQWDSTAITIEGGRGRTLTFRATGRVLVFDGFMKVAGVPTASDEQTLPNLTQQQPLHPFSLDPEQKFGSPPARYSEASLIKTLESEGIGRPSTYASIIQVIQDRKYVEQLDRRFYATDLGEVVTDKLIEAFPGIMELEFTRRMEEELDKIEDEHTDWVRTLHEFYDPFQERLAVAEEELGHAKAEIRPSPAEYRCQKCGAGLVYRFGKNGKFLSCETYPKCNFACPCDREGRPRPDEFVNVRCPKTGRPMIKKTGRFGPFITTVLEEGEGNDVGMILNLDKAGKVTAPSPPPLLTDLECPKCGNKLNLRDGIRGPWLGCSMFPKCRGRGKWAALEETQQKTLQAELDQLLAANPIPIIKTLDGRPLTDAKGKPLPDAPTVDDLLIDDPAAVEEQVGAA
ncbi:MAG: DNA topoisomerase [Planctomycetota bacterium]